MNATSRAILDIEKRWLNRLDRAGKASEIRERLGITPTRYAQMLLRVIDDPEAIASEPMLVGAVRRRLESRMRARSCVPVREMVS